jgi:guanosine-3',5'-bis(diphosphate) 3'-pyrophosphohydrolase
MIQNHTRDVIKAIQLAVKAHQGQMRADKKTPYVVHPLDVASKVADQPELVIPAILHDTLEDSGKGKGSIIVTREMIAQEFGEKVASIVEELTQDKNLPKHERRAKMIEHCGKMSPEARVIKLADRLCNMQDMKHMPQDFVDRYCDEARQMVANMKGSHSLFEEEIQNIMASYGKA